MKFRVVTTMNAAGWAEYGMAMVASFLENWPAQSKPLILYAEGFDPPPMDGLEVRALPDWLAEFKSRWGKTPAYNGHRPSGYDYRFDAVKFAHKIAALTDFGLELENDSVLVWLDADTFTHAPVTNEWLASLFPQPNYMAWLDRANSHPECGFLMFGCWHPYHRNFMEALRNLYTTGDLFKLRETHDSFAIQNTALAKVAHGKIPKPVSLSGDAFRTSHPFINGPLGACMDHMKGPRKAQGRSNKRDIIRPRPEAYWRSA